MLRRCGLRQSLGRHILAPILDAQQGRTGWKLVGWDDEQGLSLTLSLGDSLLLIEFEPRDDSAEAYARTVHFNVCVRHAFHFHRPLSRAERNIVRGVIEVVRARENVLSFERPVTSQAAQGTLVREVLVERLLVPEGAGHYYVNPYAGCMIGCEFCYVIDRSDLSRRMEGLPSLRWGRYVDVKINAAEVLRQEVARHDPGAVRMSPILTDPYQPIERTYRITRQCLEVLLEASFSPAILTRARRVLDDLDLLRRFPFAAVGFSIPSDDDAMRVAFEPGADPLEDRLEALAALHEAGVRTFAVIQPVLPMNIAQLVDSVAPHIDAVRVDRMYQVDRVRHLYQAAGLGYASTDAFFAETIREVVLAFAERGIPVDEMDDMSGLLGVTP